MVSTTTEPATSGIGWLHGMASQVSLPNMSPLRPRTARRARAFDIWPRTGWKLLIHHRVEQVRVDAAKGERTYVAALLAKREITRSVQCRSALSRGGNPLRKRVFGYGTHGEIHVGKAAAAVLRGLAIKLAGLIGGQVQLRDHSVHRGDHGAELRHKEHVHHGRRREREVHNAGGNDELIDAGNALFGVDEEPFPIERDD